MTEIESQLLDALLELENAARAGAGSGQMPDLSLLFGRIDALAGQLPPNTDPELRHYLARKSYLKAREHLQGFAAARGNCRV